MLAFNQGPGCLATRALSFPVLVGIGKISYSLYLWHWGIFVLFRWTLGLDSLWKQALAVSLTFLAAWLSFRFVETPIRSGALVRKRGDLTVIAVGTIMALVLTAAISAANSRFITRRLKR